MATIDDVDEAEELRVLALKSMVKRSKKNSSYNESDDQDIELLRAAALKTIAHKSNTQSNSLVNNNKKFTKDQLKNGPKRKNNAPPSRKSKYSRMNYSKMNYNYSSNTVIETIDDDQLEYSKDVKLENPKEAILENPKETRLENPKEARLENPKEARLENPKEARLENPKKVKWEYSKKNILPEQKKKLESNNMPNTTYKDEDIKDEVKKIVRNGSIQLSNLDSKQIDETMVLHITFSSTSESDDSDSDSIEKNILLQKKILRNHISSGLMKSTDSKDNDVNNHRRTQRLKSLENQKKKLESVQKFIELAKNSETVMRSRDEELEIILTAYKNYEEHNDTLKKIMLMIQETRREIAFYTAEESRIFEN